MADRHYEVIRKIATGGMGELYLAHVHGEHGFLRQVVIKRLHRELEEDQIYRDFFLQEGLLSGKFHHPNIVQVTDLTRDDEGYFMVMEYIIGKDLMSLVRKSISNNEFIPLHHALNIILQIGEGLHYVHNLHNDKGKHLGLVHRDVTPQNIIVTLDGFAKLVDFGVASVSGVETSPGEGIIPGKINYMAPELLMGAAPDRRADIFSLGVMLYELTVGKRLFKGNRNEVKDLILNRPYPTPTSVKPKMDPALEQIILRSLERDPDLRYPSAKAMAEEIELFALNRKLSLSRSSLSTYVRNTFSTEPHLFFAPEDSLEREEIPINLDVKFLEEWNDEGAMGAEIPDHDLSDLDDEAYFELMADPGKFSEYLRQRGDDEAAASDEAHKETQIDREAPAKAMEEPELEEPEEPKEEAPREKRHIKASPKALQNHGKKTDMRDAGLDDRRASSSDTALWVAALLVCVGIGVAIGYLLH